MLKKRPVVHAARCESCRSCMQACPVSCITMTRVGRHGKYRNVFPEIAAAACIGCGQCAAACPLRCIDMEAPPV